MMCFIEKTDMRMAHVAIVEHDDLLREVIVAALWRAGASTVGSFATMPEILGTRPHAGSPDVVIADVEVLATEADAVRAIRSAGIRVAPMCGDDHWFLGHSADDFDIVEGVTQPSNVVRLFG